MLGQLACEQRLRREVVSMFFTYIAECAYQYLDNASRRLGYFVKVIAVQDLTGAPFSREKRFFNALGMAAKRNEWLYPLKDLRAIIFRPPTWISFVFGIAKHFLPKSLVEKVHIHSGVPLLGEPGCDISRCPWASRLLDRTRVPQCLGGADADEVAGLPNEAHGTWAQRHPGERWDAPMSDAALLPGGCLIALRFLPDPAEAAAMAISEMPAPSTAIHRGTSAPEFFSPRSEMSPEVSRRVIDVGAADPSCCRRWCCWRRRSHGEVQARDGPLLQRAC